MAFQSSGVELSFQAVCADEALRIDYTLTNRTAAAVFLFDRKASIRAPLTDSAPFGVVDPAWMYVEMVSDGLLSRRAVLRRALDRHGPPGTHPRMPFVRRLDAGESVRRSFSMALPLREFAPDKVSVVDWSRGGTQFRTVDVRSVELGIGWSTELPPEPWGPYVERASFDGEELLVISPSLNSWLNTRQQVALAPVAPVNCPGLAYVAP
jgi:hypothetical protein